MYYGLLELREGPSASVSADVLMLDVTNVTNIYKLYTAVKPPLI